MKEIILAIDIGHNVPYDTGAVGIRREDDLNMLVGNALISKLRGRGIKVVNCTPNTAKSLNDSLYQRVITANNSGATLFVSIHHNACPGGYGAEVLCIKNNYQGGLSTKVGEAILNELSSLGLRNRGVKDRREVQSKCLLRISHSVHSLFSAKQILAQPVHGCLLYTSRCV